MHITRANIALLQETFPGRIICRHGDVNLPPRSCDLTSLDFFLWDYNKDCVYAAVKNQIFQVMAEIPPNMCQKLVENYLKGNSTLHGGHLNNLVFHT